MGNVTPINPAAGSSKVRAPEPLNSSHDINDFDCGKPELNDWLVRRALASEGKSARTFVVTIGNKVVAYYCMAAGSVRPKDLPRATRHGNPTDVPIIVIGRLAVDQRFERRGFGRGLLKDALLRALTAADLIGVRAVIVHTIDEEAAKFYVKFGFVKSSLNERTYALPIETAKKVIG